jgi:hypothetical protein
MKFTAITEEMKERSQIESVVLGSELWKTPYGRVVRLYIVLHYGDEVRLEVDDTGCFFNRSDFFDLPPEHLLSVQSRLHRWGFRKQ